jgi:hypothetical protein
LNCHIGPQLTGAGTPQLREREEGGLVERMFMGGDLVDPTQPDPWPAHYDNGFYNIGVTPTVEDIGLGGRDPISNHPLSFTRQYQEFLLTGKNMIDRFEVNPCTFEVRPCETLDFFREAVDGAFKVPGLRNIELTGPYFHNGSRGSLEQVVEFYNRGGDSQSLNDKWCEEKGLKRDNTGFDSSDPFALSRCSNRDADITALHLTPEEKAGLAAFMRRPLTDERVRCEKAPFDHPQLKVSDGHVGDVNTVTWDTNGAAKDLITIIPAIGAEGRCIQGGPGPIQGFYERLQNGQ